MDINKNDYQICYREWCLCKEGCSKFYFVSHCRFTTGIQLDTLKPVIFGVMLSVRCGAHAEVSNMQWTYLYAEHIS